MKIRKFTILILIAIVMSLALVIPIRETQHTLKINSILEAEADREGLRLENSIKSIENYNKLQKEKDELYLKYEELAAENGFYQGWELYQVTAYTGLDDGCDEFAATGININQLSKYYNFCAADWDLIPPGAVVLVKFDTGIEGFLSVDCGGAIKGRHIDLYFVNDLDSAFDFGNRQLEVKIIR
jgi:3D (Asp-Asp-Asp) domain-containing protein